MILHPGTLHLVCSRLDRGEIDSEQFLAAFTRSLARVIGCTRAGLWIYCDPPRHRVLRCLALYDTQHNRMVAAPDRHAEDGEAYFEHLARCGVVEVTDTFTDPRVRGFLDDHLRAHRVRSVLDVRFSINGSALGMFSCEQVDDAQAWSGRHLQLLRAIGPRAALSLTKAQQRVLDTAPGALWEPRDPTLRLTRLTPLHG